MPVAASRVPVGGRVVIVADSQHAVARAGPVIRNSRDAIAHAALAAHLQEPPIGVAAAIEGRGFFGRRAHGADDQRLIAAGIGAAGGDGRGGNDVPALGVAQLPLARGGVHEQGTGVGLHAAPRSILRCARISAVPFRAPRR